MKLFGYYILPAAQIDGVAQELRMVKKQLKCERHTNQRLRQEYKHMLAYVTDIKKLMHNEAKDG